MNSLEAQLSPKCRDEAMDPKVAVGSPISHFQARYETRLSGNSAVFPSRKHSNPNPSFNFNVA